MTKLKSFLSFDYTSLDKDNGRKKKETGIFEIKRFAYKNNLYKNQRCCQITQMKYNAKKMQQRNKSKHRSLTTKALMIRTLEMRGICVVNHQKTMD